MNKIDYYNAVNSIKDKVHKRLFTNEEKTSINHAFLKTNKRNYCDQISSIPFSLDEFIKNIYFIEMFNEYILKEYKYGILDNIKIINDIKTKTRPSVFIAMHFSAFRAIPFALKYLGLEVTVVINANFKSSIPNFDEFNIEYIYSDEFLFFSIENCLRNNKNILIYIDANWANEVAESKYIISNFLNNKIKLRKNIFEVAYKRNWQLIPVTIEEDEMFNLTMHIYKGINKTIEKQDVFIQTSVDIITTLYDPLIRKRPSSWTQWTGAHKLLIKEELSCEPALLNNFKLLLFFLFKSNIELKFNSSIYTLYKNGNDFYILNMQNLDICKIPELIFQILYFSEKITIKLLRRVLSVHDIKFLLIRQIINNPL